MQALALVEALLNEVVIVPTDSVEDPTFKRQLYDIKRSDPQFFDLIIRKYRQWRHDPLALNFIPKFSRLYAAELPGGWRAVALLRPEPMPKLGKRPRKPRPPWPAGTMSGRVTWLVLLPHREYEDWLNRQ